MWLEWAELPAAVRRNLAWEMSYGVSAGVVSALSLLAQVTVLGSLSGGPAEVTVIAAAMPASALLQPLWAHLARYVRLQHLALLSGALRCCPLLAMGFVRDSWAFAALVVTYYVLAGPLSLATSALYRYNYPDSHRGRIIGLFRMVQQATAMVVMLFSAWALDRHPQLFSIIYPIGGVLGLLGLLGYGQLRIPGDSPRERALHSAAPTPANIRAVLRQDVNFRLFQATIFLTGAGFLMSRPIWIYLLRDQYHLGQMELSLLVMVMPIILGALTSPGWGAFIDRTSPVAGRVAFALLGIFAYAALFLSFFSGYLWLAYAGAILRGLVLGAAEVSLTTGNLYFSLTPERAALYESISALFQGFRGLIMPMVGFAVFQFVGIWLFLLPTFLNAWSLVLAVRLLRRGRDLTWQPPEDAEA